MTQDTSGGPREGPAFEVTVDCHPGPLELVDLVRGTLERPRERLLLEHCLKCPRCSGVVRAVAALRRARALHARPGLEQVGGGAGPIH